MSHSRSFAGVEINHALSGHLQEDESQWKILKPSSKKLPLAVASQRRSFTRDSKRSYLTGKMLVFWISGLLLSRVVVHCIHGGSTFVVFVKPRHFATH